MMMSDEPEIDDLETPAVITRTQEIINSLQSSCSGYPCDLIKQLCLRIAELELGNAGEKQYRKENEK